MFKKSVKPQFEYAGHAMGLKFQQFENEWHLSTFSMSSREIIGGTYPKNFAEDEALDAITNLTMSDKNLDSENLASVEESTRNAIARLISKTEFQAVK
jgi:hypothetical protein